MYDFNGDGIMDPGEEYLAFRIWEEECLVEEEEENSRTEWTGKTDCNGSEVRVWD